MDRCKEYSCFALSFAGLGYIALRLLTSLPFGNGAAGVHAPVLPPALNVIGAMAAVFAVVRLLSIAVRQRRSPLPAAIPQPAAALPLAPRQNSFRTPPPVKPRSHFGLRGIPR